MRGTCIAVKDTIQSKLKDRDQFAEGFNMKLDAGSADVRTYSGSICSLLLAFVVLLYTYLKIDVLINKKDITIMTAINNNFFTSDDVLSYENNLNVAAAFTAYDSETEIILEPEYGELVFKHFAWGEAADGSGYVSERQTIKSTH